MGVVWQKLHILSRAQVFVVASMCAVVIALAVALASIPADGTSWNRFLGPSRQHDPFINFGSAFVSVLPILLGYYHLARLGAFLGVAISALTCYATQVSAGFIFVFQVVGRSLMLQEATYVGVWMLLAMFLLWAHIKTSNSEAIRDAQRSLHLADLQTH
jgi:energy-converting hydrogenase Eha subunit A